MSGPTTTPPHVVIAGTRRAWSREEKRAIITETQTPATSVSAVARRHGLHPSLLFRWRREEDEERRAALSLPPAFVPLALPAPAPSGSCEQPAPGVIEIELAGGHCLRADTRVDLALLRGVIEALLPR